MSDQWLVYPCELEEQVGLIFYDHGIADTLDETVPGQLLKVSLDFKQADANGLPDDAEGDQLMTLEEGLDKLVDEMGAYYVGRITLDGQRHFYIYTAEAEDQWNERLATLSSATGYELTYGLEADEEHEGYWGDLFPTDEDWRLIQDMQVIDALEEEGDDGTAERPIEHWAYFPTPENAAEFSDWVVEQGYQLAEADGEANTGEPDEEGQYVVRFLHLGSTELDDISAHTLALHHKAQEFDGEYDGWEPEVVKPE